jgi:hypothetical protein
MTASSACVLALGCSEVIVEDDGRADICLWWSAIAPSVADAPPTALACELAASVENFGGMFPNPPSLVPSADYELHYVCIEAPASGQCLSPQAAETHFGCLESNDGQCHFGDTCTSTFVWSACGPDPSVSGGCCYYAYVVTTTFLT